MRAPLLLLPLLAAVLLAALSVFWTGLPDDREPHRRPVELHRPPLPALPPAELLEDAETPQTFDVVPLRHALEAATARYRGRVIAAELVPPHPAEAARRVQLVYALRMLTPEHDLLLIRLDARDGSFLEAAGNDLHRARRIAPPRTAAGRN